MPSSMIFASLVVLWLLILVPAVARHRQEVVRPSVAALAGRVLVRPPRRRSLEVDGMVERNGTDVEDGRVVATRTAEVQVPSARTEPDLSDAEPAVEDAGAVDDLEDVDDVDDWTEADERGWERPPARYRAGRGGFDAEAAAMTARARYAFRQRVVLMMLVAAVTTGIVAAVALPALWWAHGAVDVVLVGYLVYLRRQVRMEEAIRARRAARMAGTRRPPAANDPDLDDWAERGRAGTRPAADDEPVPDEDDDEATEPEALAVSGADDEESAEDQAAVAGVVEEERPALPRLPPTPTPPLPAGTALVEDEDDELDLDDGSAPGYRRAVGQ